MPLYQVQTKVNSQTVNTDIECDSKDDVINFFNSVSVGDVFEVKEYVYSLSSSFSPQTSTNRYASVRLTFDNRLPITIKIPSLKVSKNETDIINLFRSLYLNIKKIDVTITLKK